MNVVVHMAVWAGAMDRQLMVRLARGKVRVRLLGTELPRVLLFDLGARTGLPVEQAEKVYPLKLYC